MSMLWKAIQLHWFCDPNMTDNVNTGKSTSRYVFTLTGCAVSRCSRFQRIVALPTTDNIPYFRNWSIQRCHMVGMSLLWPWFTWEEQSYTLITKLPYGWLQMPCFVHALWTFWDAIWLACLCNDLGHWCVMSLHQGDVRVKSSHCIKSVTQDSVDVLTKCLSKAQDQH